MIDRPASRRWDRHMSAVRLSLHTGLRVPRARRWRAVTVAWLFLRAEARRRWRAWLSLALIVGVFAGGVVTAAAGALRTGSAYARSSTGAGHRMLLSPPSRTSRNLPGSRLLR